MPFSIPADEVCHQFENGLIAVKDGRFPIVIDGVVIREGIAVFVLQKDARYVTDGEGLVVAVGRQGTAVQGLEVLLLAVDLLK